MLKKARCWLQVVKVPNVATVADDPLEVHTTLSMPASAPKSHILQ